MEAVRTEGLSRRFGDEVAVDGLTVGVEPGGIFGLVGPDGAGKTTVLRMLAGILEPTAGEAWVAGRHTVREAEALKEEIGYMSQRFGLYPDLTVWENLRFYAEIYGVPRRSLEAKAEALLGFSGLTPFRRRLAGALSGGMKQKLGLACALVHTPKVLLLDEPTNGVDPVSRRDFWRILHQLLREGVTILVTTSYLDEAERCGRVGLLHRGRLVAVGTPDETRGAFHGSVLEVRTPEVRRAAGPLRAAFGSHAVTLFGNRLHVVAAEAQDSAGRIRRALEAEGIAVDGLRAIDPSIEDVFMSVAGEAGP
jgi:ABC-2 type transport system ATP-binding protein